MGVPAFYRWLSEKYPKIVQDVLEDRVHLVAGQGSIRVPFDATKPNPSGLEADNLYIDMNGIIHPCSHPENGPQPKNEQEMYENVCLYVDRLMRAVRPRKLLYLAIDGVAPRAKMNQQRSRRFRSAQEARERAETEVQVRESLEEQGVKVAASEKPWDSNVITPGTKFMIDLSEYIRFYVRKRIATDKAWKNIKVIFSDASVPGEGEHKIMSHVRQQRAQPGYNPNLVHVLHGLDADLIMLALATHEAHFYILREEVLFGRRSVEATEQRREESGFAFKQKLMDEAAGGTAMELPENANKPLQRLSVPVLREYLANEFSSVMNPPFRGEVSFERLVDDVVFMCFFVGNDFLPHLPSLDIRDGGLDYLFNVYKRLLPGLGGYLTDHGGKVNLDRVDVILAEVGAIEDHVFQLKHKNEENDKRRRQMQKQNRTHGNKMPAGGIVNAPQQDFQKLGRAGRMLAADNKDIKLQRGHTAKEELRQKLKGKTKPALDNANAAEALKRELLGGGTKRKASEIASEETSTASNGDEEMTIDETETSKTSDSEMETEEDKKAAAKKLKEKIKAIEQAKLDDYAKNVKDNVKLHEAGWKDRYYTDKCKADDVQNNGGREHLFRSYVKGLCWVMKYYYEGCPSWKWYFPFHYAPFASDLRNIERFQKDCETFDDSEPFKPIEQLLSVLPEDSSHAVPKEARWLMADEESPIIDFYPHDVPCDPNGKAMPWLWVVLLPFIDEERLLAALHPTMKKWTTKELLCNSRGLDDGYVFLHKEHALSKEISFVVTSKDEYVKNKFCLSDKDVAKISSFFGFVRKPLSHELYEFDDNSMVPLPASASKISRSSDLFSSAVEPNEAICLAFTEPTMKSHRSEILSGAVLPPSILTDEDRRIRRPRLNRGGDTIANMGGHNKSHQSGYGSMNISSYERDLAMKTGRGKQMYQAGTRAWGAMEPTPKRHMPTMNRWQPPPPMPPPPPTQQQQWPTAQNPFNGNYNNPAQQRQHNPYQQPPPQQQQYAYQQQQQGRPQQQQYSYQQQRQPQQQQQYSFQHHNRNQQQQAYGGGRQQNQVQQGQHTRFDQQSQSGYSFNRQGGQQQQQYQQPPPPQQQQPQQQARQQQPQGRANLNNLRAQLMSTLKNQRNSK